MDGRSRASAANTVLRGLLDEAGLSNAALARAVVRVGAEEGIHLGTNTTSVKRMLDGCEPRWPVPRLVAKVLSRRLRHEVSVTRCGFADRTPVAEDRYDGFQCAGTLDGTVRTVVELSGRDMERRKFLLGSVFSAAAFSEPALFALTAAPAGSTSRAAGRRVGMADVEVINEHLAHLRRLDHSYGSARVREQVVQLLHREAETVLNSTYSEKTGKALISAVAQAARLAGSTAIDIGRHSVAQRYYIQALDLAMSAGDRVYAADVLAGMSWLAIHIGHGMHTDHDRARHARHAIAQIRAGHSVANGAATPMLSALLHAVEARAHALLGDVNATRMALRTAESQHERVRQADEPASLGCYAQAQLDADLGRCLREIGDHQAGIRLLAQAVNGCQPWRVRSRSDMQIDLAAAHLAGRDFEQAASVGRDAIRTAAQVSSTRSLDRLRILQRQVRPLRAGSTHLTELDDRITTLLTRDRTRRNDVTAP